MAVPTFHGIGITAQVLTPLVTGLPVVFFTPQAPAPPVLPNPKNMIDVAVVTGCNAMVSVPLFVEVRPPLSSLFVMTEHTLGMVSRSGNRQILGFLTDSGRCSELYMDHMTKVRTVCRLGQADPFPRTTVTCLSLRA